MLTPIRKLFYGTSNAGYATKVLALSPIAYWPLNETSGLVAKDSSGNSRNGTYNGPVLASIAGPGPSMGLAPLFDGINDLVDITADAVFNVGTGDLTMASWINAANANQTAAVISGKRNAVSGFAYMMGVGSIASTGTPVAGKNIYFWAYAGNIAFAQSYHTTANVVDGSWHHVVARRASGIVTIWIDGTSAALTADKANTTAPNADNVDSYKLACGTGSFFYAGVIGHSAFWNSALPDATIAALAVAS